MSELEKEIVFRVNGSQVITSSDPRARLSDLLRDGLGLTGTKVGCNAGDCGACSVLMNGELVCACLVPAGRLTGANILTVEGLANNGKLSALQRAFHHHGAAQCGICTPGMLLAAHDLLARQPHPTRGQVMEALGGVLCRCTGYQNIIEAVVQAPAFEDAAHPPLHEGRPAVGARTAKTDGMEKITGAEKFGADCFPEEMLWLKVIRSPFARADFTLGDLTGFQADHPGLACILTAADVPGRNSFGIYPDLKDQPVLAEGHVRYQGEAVLALVGNRNLLEGIAEEEVPITWEPRPPVEGIEGARAEDAPALHGAYPDNVLTRAKTVKGDLEAGFASAAAVSEGVWETGFVEHAYIEPEAGFARRVEDRIEVFVTTQTPYMNRDEVAPILGIEPEQVRIIPSAVGGGFGGKLDLNVHPLIALAAWKLERPVGCTFTRPESMASSTKRHPARIQAKFACDEAGLLTAVHFEGLFDTGAYASWGPTVAGRVPVHATGPYHVPAVVAKTAAYYTNAPPAGAFRGFGIPQAALAHEGLMDDLAEKMGQDRLEFRLRNALRIGQSTATGQVLTHSAGLAQCLEALQPDWKKALADVHSFNSNGNGNSNGGTFRRGVGIGCMWYGIGNTSMSNPSIIKVGLAADGTLTLYSGAVDIGQGVNTILTQICADAVGVPVERFSHVLGDTDLTFDAGKTSASRQTFVSGKAAQLAGAELREKMLELAGAGAEARIEVGTSDLRVEWENSIRSISLEGLPQDAEGNVLIGIGTFDPPTTPLNEQGQGTPYATYGFAAQMATVEVDMDLGTVRVLEIVAAHDMGRAINPTQVEGQIHGGIAQGLGLALMEEYLPGRTENLHDYLIPTSGDLPEIRIILVEDPEPLGPFGAKGIGEPALVATAPAILGAIRHAGGAVLRRVPATPPRVLDAIRAARKEGP